MRLLWPIVIRDMRARSARSVLTIAAVALGVALVVAITSTHETLRASLLEWIKRWTGPADVAVNLEDNVRDPQAALADLRALPSVEAAGPRLYFSALPIPVTAPGRSAPPIQVLMVGVPVETGPRSLPPSQRIPPLTAGRTFGPGEPDAILLDARTAAELGVAPGGTVRLPAMFVGEPAERAEVTARVVGVFEAPPPEPNRPPGRALAPLASVQEWTGEPGLVNTFEVRLKPGLSDVERAVAADRVAGLADRSAAVYDRAAQMRIGQHWPPGSDFVVRPHPPPRDHTAVAEYLRGRPGVQSVAVRLRHYPLLVAPVGADPEAPPLSLQLVGLGPQSLADEARRPKLAAGRLPEPAETDAVALSQSAAAALRAEVGASVRLPPMWTGLPVARAERTLRVVGVYADPPAAEAGDRPASAVTALPLARELVSAPDRIDRIDVAVAPTADPARIEILMGEVARLTGERAQVVPGPASELLVRLFYTGLAEADAARLADRIRALPGVSAVSPRLSSPSYPVAVADPARPDVPREAVVVGLGDPREAPPVVAGRGLDPAATDGLLLDVATAEALGLKVGDPVLLPPMWAGRPGWARGPLSYKLVGLTAADPEAPEGIGVLHAPLAAAQAMQSQAGRVNALRVAFAASADQAAREAAAAKIGSMVAPGDIGRVLARYPMLTAEIPPLPDTDRLLWELRRLPGVAAVSPRLFQLSQFVQLVSPAAGPDRVRVQIMGVDSDESQRGLKIIDRVPPLVGGRVFRPGERGVILLDADTAAALKVEVGDVVRVPGEPAVEGRPAFRERPAQVIGLFAPAAVSAAKGVGTAVAPLADVQEWTDNPGLVNRIDVAFGTDLSPDQRRALTDEIIRLVGDRGKVQPWAGRQEQIEQNLGLVKLVIQLVSMAALLCSVFIVLNTLSINVLERIQVIGMLRCLGMTRGQTAAAVFFESLLVGAAGLAAGVPLGLLFWTGVVEIFAGELAVPAVSWDGIALAVIGGLLSVIAAAVWPALRATRVTPLAAVQAAGGEAGSRFLRWSWPFGAALLAAQVFAAVAIEDPAAKLFFYLFVGLPMVFVGWFLLSPLLVRYVAPVLGWAVWAVGRLFSGLPVQLVGNSLRQQQRSTALAACALMVGAGLVVAITINSDSLVQTWKQRLPSNFPELYAVGPGSYAEELAYRYYLANKARIDALRAEDNPFEDDEGRELRELVRSPNEEAYWQPFLRAWREINGIPPDRPEAGLTEIYIQGVQMNRPLRGEAVEGIVPRDAAMVAVEPAGFLDKFPVKFLRGDRDAAVRRLAEGGAALIPDSVYKSGTLDLGSTFTVNLDPGSPEKAKTFEVVGVVELGVLELVFMYLDPMAGPDSLTSSVFVVGKRDAVARVDPRGLPDKRYRYKSNVALAQQKIMVGSFAPGVDTGQAVPKLRAAAGNLVIDSIAGLLAKLHSEFERIVGIVRGIGWMTMAIAGLGVANVMFMKILRQRRQIGVLRALGLTRRQTVGLVLGESVVVGLIGGLLGAALGIHLSLMGQYLDGAIFGLEYDFHFPTGYVLITLAVSAGICLAAGVLPARRAARMKIVAALAR